MEPAAVQASFEIDGGAFELHVDALSGSEALSDIYRFELSLRAPSARFDFGAQVGKAARVALRSGSYERIFHGIVSRFEQPHDAAQPVFKAELVPRAWLLDLASGCRVLAGLSVPEIVKRLLDEHGVSDVRFDLASSYGKRDVTVQYRESDWAFLSRLLEAEGIHYFFEHSTDRHVLVLSDRDSAHEPLDGDGDGALPFRPSSGALDAEEGVMSFGIAQRIRPGRVTVRDYPDNPRLAKEESASAEGDAAIGRYEFPATRAEMRLHELRVSRRVGSGRARSLRLAAGRAFTLREHPREEYDAGYLLTRVEHSFSAASGHTAAFSCVPVEQPYRPERRTPVPRIHGVQSATVVGPPGVEIHTDELGRALVRFHWDRGASLESACWVPVAHHAAGPGSGAVHIPHVGDAVLVEFMDGDPDRPLVSGRIYSAVNKHPHALPANATKAVFRDASSPGGQGYNELSFDCAAGTEQVFLRAQRDLRIESLRNAERVVGQDEELSVARHRSVSVDGNNMLSVTGDDIVEVGGSQSLQIVGGRTIAVDGDHVLQIAGESRRQVVGDSSVVLEGALQVVVQGAEKRAIQGESTNVYDSARRTSVTGDDSLSVTGNRIESVSGNLQQVVDGATSALHGSLQTAVSGDYALRAEGELRIESKTIEKIGAPSIYIAASSKLYLRAREQIVLEVGDSKLTVEDGKIYITNGGVTKTLSGDKVKLNC